MKPLPAMAIALAIVWIPCALADPFEDWQRERDTKRMLEIEQERNDILRRQADQQWLQMMYQMQAGNAAQQRLIQEKLADLNRKRAALNLASCHLGYGGVDAMGNALVGELVCPTTAEEDAKAAKWHDIKERLAQYNKERRADGLKPCRLKESFEYWKSHDLDSVHAICP
jgi:hypothetical protein